MGGHEMLRAASAGILLLLLLTGCSVQGPAPSSGPELIAVVPKGTTHLYWRSIEKGARAAGRDHNVEILWKGPLKENDRAMQIALVEQLVTQKVSGIVLAPLDDQALLRPVRAAKAAGIPVLIFDTGLKGQPGSDFISFVATDNFAAGRLAGQAMAEFVKDPAKVGLLRYQVGSGSTTDREEGFLDHAHSDPSLEVILDNQYGGVTAGETIEKSESLLDTLRQLDGLFCPTEPTTSGVLITLRKYGLAGRLHLVGFDSSAPLQEALENGEIDALVVQEPEKMAYLAVQTMVRYLRGEPIETKIDTPARVLTRETPAESR
jgi:ribose transport system substrate-binding protein